MFSPQSSQINFPYFLALLYPSIPTPSFLTSTLPPGRGGFLWPGLNAPVLRAGEVQTMSRRGEAEQVELQAELVRQREDWDRRRKMRVKRERGWTGHSWGGISLGAPDPGPNGGEGFRGGGGGIVLV